MFQFTFGTTLKPQNMMHIGTYWNRKKNTYANIHYKKSAKDSGFFFYTQINKTRREAG